MDTEERERRREAGRRYRAHNKERLNAQRRERMADPAERERMREYHRVWYATNKDKTGEYAQRAKQRQKSDPRILQKRKLAKFKMTLEQYQTMWDAQEGLCALCGQPEKAKRSNGAIQMLAVDHDRSCCPGDKSCGKCVRGLLCFTCNTTMGKVELLGLAKIHRYLERDPVVTP